MTTALHYFLSFCNKQREFNQKVVKFMSNQDKRWKEQHEFNKKQHEFNQQILSLVQSLVKRIDNLVIKNNLKE